MTTDPAPLEDLLEGAPYLEDGGFTARVMAGLPARRRDPRRWALGLSSAAAALTALAVLPGAVQAGLAALAAAALPAPWLPVLLLGGLAAAAAALVAALVVTLEAWRAA
jgi:hypothetical protein